MSQLTTIFAIGTAVLFMAFVLGIRDAMSVNFPTVSKKFPLKPVFHVMGVNVFALIAVVAFLYYGWMGKLLSDLARQAEQIAGTAHPAASDVIFMIVAGLMMLGFMSVVLYSLVLTFFEFVTTAIIGIMLSQFAASIKTEKDPA